MAYLNGPFKFNGSLSNLTFYKRRDSDKTIVKEKWAPTREQIMNDKRFALTKKNCTEWDGCSKASKWIRRVLQPLDAVRDYNHAGTLSGLMKQVQKSDSISVYGERSVLLSEHPHLLKGFTLSRRTHLETLVRVPITCTINKAASSAIVALPQLVAGANFAPATPLPYFRLIASVGVVPDMLFTLYGYTPDIKPGHFTPAVAYTEWLGVKGGAPAREMELSLPYAVPFASYSLVLAVGLSFGTLDALGNIIPVKYSGSGRIIEVV